MLIVIITIYYYYYYYFYYCPYAYTELHSSALTRTHINTHIRNVHGIYASSSIDKF